MVILSWSRRALPIAVALLGLGCRVKTQPITEPFSDDFERAEVGPQWLNTGAEYRVAGGRLNIAGAHNHPLWLRRTLPRDFVVELDAVSTSPDGDLKIELCGDGVSFDPDGNRYDTTGYVLFFGGHRNTNSIIGRLGEHDAQIAAERTDVRVVPNRVYHWTVSKKGGKLDWLIDGKPFLSYVDPSPLSGAGHEFFAFNDWETNVFFDNLRIRPAP